MEVLLILYPWIKSLHLIAVISWLAGIFYLPRLFVYHVETNRKNINPKKTLEIWEHLLLKKIMNPAMIITWICGFLLILTPGIIDWTEKWIWVKLICVLLMTGFHGFLSKQRKLLKNNIKPYSGKVYRLLNEIPTILMIIIIIMVIVKPF